MTTAAITEATSTVPTPESTSLDVDLRDDVVTNLARHGLPVPPKLTGKARADAIRASIAAFQLRLCLPPTGEMCQWTEVCLRGPAYPRHPASHRVVDEWLKLGGFETVKVSKSAKQPIKARVASAKLAGQWVDNDGSKHPEPGDVAVFVVGEDWGTAVETLVRGLAERCHGLLTGFEPHPQRTATVTFRSYMDRDDQPKPECIGWWRPSPSLFSATATDSWDERLAPAAARRGRDEWFKGILPADDGDGS